MTSGVLPQGDRGRASGQSSAMDHSLLFTFIITSGLSPPPPLPPHCHQPPVPNWVSFFFLFLLSRYQRITWLSLLPEDATLLKTSAYKPRSTAAGNQVEHKLINIPQQSYINCLPRKCCLVACQAQLCNQRITVLPSQRACRAPAPRWLSRLPRV